MKLKSIAERFTGPGVEVAPPADKTPDAEQAAAAGRLRALLAGAATESGQRVRDLHEWQGVRHVVTSVRLKARLATGMPEGRARREIDAELDDLEDEISRLTAESRGLEQQQAAERARRQVQEFERVAGCMRELTAEMLRSPELGRVVAWLTPFHVRALEIRNGLIAASSNQARLIPDSAPYRGLREWTPGELIARVVTDHGRHKGERP